MTEPKDGPVLITLEAGQAMPDPAGAPAVPETTGAPPTAMTRALGRAARPSSRLWRWFWALALMLLGFVVSVAAWNFVAGLLAANPVLGAVASALLAALVALGLILALREASAFARLARVDGLRRAAEAALASGELAAARAVTTRLEALYRARPELDWGRARFAARAPEVLDGDGLIALAEAELVAPLDALALREVEAAARQVALVTAMVPLALADVVTALAANLRMIRRIAEIYGGRAGTLGSWRLTRAVMTHLVATGAVAVGDDLIGTLAGGGVLSKLSRRFGEGVVNGALTARVGVAALEVCRPLPFTKQKRPSVTLIVKRALTGLFDRG